MKLFEELIDKLNIFKKGFRVHLIDKPKTDEEILFEIDKYQKYREEKYRYFKKNKKLMMERNGKNYKIEVIETRRTLLYPQPKLGTIAGTWVIEVTEVKKNE